MYSIYNIATTNLCRDLPYIYYSPYNIYSRPHSVPILSVETDGVVRAEEIDFVEAPVGSRDEGIAEYYICTNDYMIFLQCMYIAGSEIVSVVPCMSSAPNLKQLQSLRTSDGETIEIIKEIAAQWKRIGACLDFDRVGTQLELIYANKCKDGVEECCRAMFQHWLKGNGLKPVSWSTLIQILKDCDYNALASRVTAVIIIVN